MQPYFSVVRKGYTFLKMFIYGPQQYLKVKAVKSLEVCMQMFRHLTLKDFLV